MSAAHRASDTTSTASCAGRPLVLGGVPLRFRRGGSRATATPTCCCTRSATRCSGAAALGDLGTALSARRSAVAGRLEPGAAARASAGCVEQPRARLVSTSTRRSIAEAPRLAPMRDAMRAAIAEALGIATDAVSVKATTNERLGALGRGEGLAACAVAMVEAREGHVAVSGVAGPLRAEPDRVAPRRRRAHAPCSTGCSRASTAARFVLRVEDTDVQRSSAERERRARRPALARARVGRGPGSRRPVRARTGRASGSPLYRERAERLVAQGAAYPCFCTDAELEERRARRSPPAGRPHYDGHCRQLTEDERAARAARAAGERPLRRSSRATGCSTIWCAARCASQPAWSATSSCCARTGFRPTTSRAWSTTPACASRHVIARRGAPAEHAAPAHALRRAGETHAAALRARAADPEPRPHQDEQARRRGRGGGRRLAAARVTCPRRCSATWRCSGSTRATTARSCRAPSCSRRSRSTRVGKSGSVFDPDKLRWVNAHYLHHAGGASCCAWARGVPARGGARCRRRALAPLLEVVRGNLAHARRSRRRARRRSSTTRRVRARGATPCSPSRRARERVRRARVERSSRLRSGAPKRLNPRFNRSGQRLGVKGRDLFQPVRVALTGRTHGPELPLVAELLGRERACARAAPRAASVAASGRVRVSVKSGGARWADARRSARSRCAPGTRHRAGAAQARPRGGRGRRRATAG